MVNHTAILRINFPTKCVYSLEYILDISYFINLKNLLFHFSNISASTLSGHVEGIISSSATSGKASFSMSVILSINLEESA